MDSSHSTTKWFRASRRALAQREGRRFEPRSVHTMYSVYILWSESLKKYYVGQTDNRQRRVAEHNRGKSLFTKTGIPWSLVYYEDFSSRNEAVKREAEIKHRKSKTYITSLVKKKPSGSERPVVP